ncbi:MAG: hypothetical protein HZA07_00780, partial [Nitrospirae bacterium]|nr:hypothetical protein [Nitrospirota bacterium]
MNYLAVLLDAKRLSDIKGSPLEGKVTDMFGGAIKALIMEVPDDQTSKIIDNLPGARLDARFFIEEVPIAFKRALFEKIKTMKSIGTEVIDAVLADLSKIKEQAAKESESLPVPDIDISEALGLQKKAA